MPGVNPRGSSRIELNDARRTELAAAFETFYVDLFDEPISDYRQICVIDFFVHALGPAVYNQAIQDARKFVTDKLEDLDADLYEPEPAPRIQRPDLP